MTGSVERLFREASRKRTRTILSMQHLDLHQYSSIGIIKNEFVYSLGKCANLAPRRA